MLFAQVIERVVYSAIMKKLPPNRFHALPVLLTGLFVAHLVGTLQVYASNLGLFRTVTVLADAGYLTVPNRLVAPLLKNVTTALMGGVLFTLSIGAGATLLAFLTAWSWKTFCRQKKSLIVLPVLPWIILITGVNLKGVAILPTLYLTLVPAVVAALTLRFTPDHLSRPDWIRAALHVVVLLTLAVVWTTQVNSGMFITIRDRLLLSNPVGIGINDFYYRYTLYPAEAFKSLHQKMLKTCRLDGFSDPSLKRNIQRQLAEHNYLSLGHSQTSPGLPVSNDTADTPAADHPLDLVMIAAGDSLVLENGGRPMIEVSSGEFLKNPASVLKSFSEKCDRHQFFRQITFVSLLLGFPLVLYICLHFILSRAAALFMETDTAAALAATLCLAIGILLVLPIKGGGDREIPANRIPALLQSEKWQDNVDALKTIAQQRKNWRFQTENRKLINNPHIPVRYWLARSLARGKGPAVHAALLTLMADPQPIVACQAIYSLGRRKDARTVEAILNKINHSGHWYVQWYGYNALKGLGWRQTT